MSRLASFENDIDFPRLWRIGWAITAVMLVVSVGALVGRGLNLGIDLEGGTSWEVEAPDVSVSDTRDALGDTGAAGAKIQIVGGDTLRVQSEPSDDAARDAVTTTLAELAGVEASAVSVSTVGPTWGDEISSKAQRALVSGKFSSLRTEEVEKNLWANWRPTHQRLSGQVRTTLHDERTWNEDNEQVATLEILPPPTGEDLLPLVEKRNLIVSKLLQHLREKR